MSFACSVMPLNIFIDGKVVATIKNGGSCETELPRGNHELIMDLKTVMNKKQITFADNCSKIYVDIGVKMGLLVGKVDIISMTNE